MGAKNSIEKLASANSRASNAEQQVLAFQNGAENSREQLMSANSWASNAEQRVKTEDAMMKELLMDPWRKTVKDGWNAEELHQLRNEVEANKFPESAKIKLFNILMVGQISAGKSSIINSIESAIRGEEEVTNKADAGTAGQGKSLTKQLRSYKMREGKGQVQFWDTMGLEVEDEGLDIQKIEKIMDGLVRNKANLDGTLGTKYLRDTSEIEHKMHCLIFAVHANKFAALDENILGKLTRIRYAANERDIPCLVVCTAVDLVCKHVEKDTSKVFYSQAVQKMMTMVSERSGFPLNMVFPQRNYVKETVAELNIDFLTMLLFKRIVKVSKDFCERLMDDEEEDD